MKITKDELNTIIGTLTATALMMTIGKPTQESLERYRKNMNLVDKLKAEMKEQ